MELTGIDDRAPRRALAHRGSRRADGGRKVLPALLLAVSFMLALAAGVAPAPAEGRDLLILRTEIRHGELLSCDATACRLDGSTIPRRDVVWIGLGDPPLPSPTVRNPLADELHLRDGSVRPGPLVSLDAGRVVTPARAYERREVRWIYLAPPPAGSAGGGGAAGGGGGGGEEGTCRFWIGTVGRRGVFRNLLSDNTLTETVRTVYTVRLREGQYSTPGTMSIGTVNVRGRAVDLQRDDATVRERLRGTLSGSGGNRVAGSGTGHIGARPGEGRLFLAEPPGPTYYQFGVGTDRYQYPVTLRWVYGDIQHRERGPAPIYVGTDPDPEEPRIDASGRMMKGEYTRTHGSGAGTTLNESVSWELRRTTAPCDAPPGLPPLPAESDPPDDAEP